MRKFLAAVFAATLIYAAAPSANAAGVKPLAGIEVGIVGVYGYDLVKLFPHGATDPNDGVLVLGGVEHRSEHEGLTFLFSSAENAETFGKNPERYLPGGGGYCLLGLYRRAVNEPHKGDMPPPGHPAARTFAFVGDGSTGRWFFHGGPGAEATFESEPDIHGRARQAVEYFNARLADNTAGSETATNN